MTDPRKFVRTPDAALRVGLSPRTLERYRITGGGPPFRHLGRVVIYDVEHLAQWASAGPLLNSTSSSGAGEREGGERIGSAAERPPDA